MKVPQFNTTTKKWSYREFNKRQYIDFLKKKLKLPGTIGLKDTSYWLTNRTKWTKEGRYVDDIKNTKGWESFWSKEGIKAARGVIYVDDEINPTYEFFVTGYYYFYLNYCPIVIKHEKNSYTFPEVWDSDYFLFIYFELARETSKYSGVNKKRQTGFSYKIASIVMVDMWFKTQQVVKVFTRSSKNMNSVWSIIQRNRTWLENQTGWIRHFKKDDQKERFMHMMWKVQEGGQATETGRDNKLFGVLTSTDSSALVGGYNTLVIGDEVGVNKTLLDDINFIEPSIKQGGLLTGNLIIGGSVGELSDCEDLRKITYNPEEYGFLGVQDLENPTEVRLPLIPMQWNYWEGTEDADGNVIGVTRHYDIDGNSNIESAKKAINRIRELKKKQDAGSFALFCSQNPVSLNEMYQMRETNIFPTPKLNKQFLWLEMNHKDTTYELEYDAEDKVIAQEVSKQIVTDFPLKAESYREGAVVVLEHPVSTRPFIYYAGIDPVQNLMNTGSSLMSCYIYQSLYRDGNEMKGGRIVAWYTGRYTDDENTFETVRKLCKYYNAHCAIESDDGAFIEWMKGKKEHHMMFKRNQFPFLKDLIPNSSIGDEYGIRMNTGGTVSRTKQFIFSSMVEYINEVMGEITIDGYLDQEGNSVKQKIYGVERLKDQMLIKELLNYGKGNFDRVIAASIAIATGRAYESSQIIQKVNTSQGNEAPVKQYSIKAPNQFKKNQYSATGDYKSFWGKVNKMGR